MNEAERRVFATRRHGTTTEYAHGCRCPGCAKAHQAYIKAYYAANRERVLSSIKRSQEKKLAAFNAYRKTLSCVECGERRWYVLDFHHREGRAHLKGDRSLSGIAANQTWEKLMEEINRCDVLCANCHRQRHYFEGLQVDALTGEVL